MRALVVDDDVFCLKVTSEFFKYKGFEVTALLRPSCPTMEMKAKQCVQNSAPFDVIVSDNRMPGMTGLEFFEFIEEKGCQLPLAHKALLTGDLTVEEHRRAKEKGYRVFEKPCSLSSLDKWLAEILN